MVRAAIISDIHLTKGNREEALEHIEEVVEEIKSFRPEITIVLGDMIGGETTDVSGTDSEAEGGAEIKQIREKIEELQSEVLYIRGNHEQYITQKEFSEIVEQDSYGLKQVKDENFVFLDSAAPELSGSRGQISEEQLEFLDETLEELEDAVLVIHHPVHYRDLSHTYWWPEYPERAFCGDKKEINKILEKHGNVKAVFNGHIHDTDHTSYKDLDHFTIAPFISESRQNGFKDAYALIEIDQYIDVEVLDGDGLRAGWKIK